jgi:hypothetical protein
MRKGLTGDNGCSDENGEGVSGSQYDSAGTRGAHETIGLDGSDVVCGSGNVARRGVGGRGTHQDVGWMVRGAEAGRGRIVKNSASEPLIKVCMLYPFDFLQYCWWS